MKRKYLTSWFKKNGPTLCTIGACAGVVTTSMLSVRAGMKTKNISENIQNEKIRNLWDDPEYGDMNITEISKRVKPTIMDITKYTWTYYIPVVGSLLGTCFCIIGSNKLNKKNQAALASAYIGAQEYIKQLKNTLDKNGINEIEVSDEHLHECLDDFISEDDEKHIFYYIYVKDDIGNIEGKYFESTIRDVVLAEYHINRNFILKGGMTVNETLDWFNLPRTPMGDVLCWDVCSDSGYQWIDFDHEKIVNDNEDEYYGRDVYIITCPFDAEIPQE